MPAPPPDPAARVLVVYTSDSGTTHDLALSVADGARSAGAHADAVRLLTGREVDPAAVPAYDALLVGTPVRHRQMHHRVKLFVEVVLEALWLEDAMVGMVGGVFSVGGGHGDVGAGAEMAQVGLLASLAANGLVLVPLPKTTPGADHAGLHWGPAGRTGGPKMEPLSLTGAAREAGRHHGANVARVAAALAPHRGRLFARGNEAPSPDALRAFGTGGRAEPPGGFPSAAGFAPSGPSADVRL